MPLQLSLPWRRWLFALSLPLLQRRLESGRPCAVVVAVAVVAVCSFFAAATVCCPSHVGCERECKRDGRFRQVLRSVPGVLNLVLVLQLSDPALVPGPALVVLLR
uniref:Uncharacterized protein n=1 Tax=Pseudo-nitzschia australis TaxID=44445 RepID=A0A7S4AU82_9STRA